MKRAMQVLAAAALIGLPIACHHHARARALESNFASVRVLEGGRVLSGHGEPFTGTLVARDEEIVEVARSVLVGTPLADVETLDTRGLIVEVPVHDGVLSGRAVLHADLSSDRVNAQLEGRSEQFSLELARQLGATVEVASATFEAGKLDGRAVLVAPRPDSTSSMGTVAEAEFRDNVLHGTAKEYWAGTQTLRREMEFSDGQLSGPSRRYYESGALETETLYAEGRPHGTQTEYYEDGATRAETRFEGGQRVGTRRRWFPTGVLQLEATGDGAEAVVTEWYSNGAIKSETSPAGQVDHAPEGQVMAYHSNGRLRARARYVDGLEQGVREVFYSDGTRWETLGFAGGKPHGAHDKWWKNGRHALHATWDEGELQGAYERWYASGQRWEQATYEHGKREGPYLKWWKNGAVAHDYAYEGGKIDGEYRTFYDNGAVWAVGEYVDGKPQGTIKRWFPDGRLGYVMHHRNGRPDGAFKRWYADGQPRLEAVYVDGRLDGEFKNWREDGSVYELATFARGKKIQTNLADPTKGMRG